MGYNPSLFWDSSLQEVFDLIESYNRKVKLDSEEKTAEIKMQIILDSALAKWIGENVACLMDKKAKITPANKLFPELFKSEDNESIASKKAMDLYKARMGEFTFRHNAKLKKKEV